jgi:hypothetical protein
MTAYGYARVSTDGQTLDAQLHQLRVAGAEKVFSEEMSPVLRHAQNAVRVGHRPPPEAGHSSLDGGERGVILWQVENDIRACKGRRTTARSFWTTDLYCTDSALSVP